MKFLVDVCTGGRLAIWLKRQGHDVQEVRERAGDMDDDEILQWAYTEDRVVITVDKDFGALAIALNQPHHGIVRLPDVPALERQQLMQQVLSNHEADLNAGALITVTRDRIRVRRA